MIKCSICGKTSHIDNVPGHLCNECSKTVTEVASNEKKSLKERNKLLLVISTIIISLGLIVFYWLALRPTAIKKDCHSWAGNQSGYDKTKTSSTEKKYDLYYKDCIRGKGL